MEILLFTLLVFGAFQISSSASPYSTSLETTLRTNLFTGYEVLQRPEQTVKVQISFNLITINSLDIKAQALSTSGYFGMGWHDSRLAWISDPTYDNVNFLFSTEEYTWRPAIVIENSASDLEVFSDTNTLIRLISSGKAYWTPGGVFQTHCEADITYYPLDTQECSVVLSTWAYTSGEVELEFGESPFVLDNFKKNGEWEIIETSTESESTTRKEGSSYSRLYFKMKLRRRPLFHILNTLFPVILLASLIVFVFKLPPESGERVGMSLTVLLAYAVYLTLISDNIPQTSLSASILSTYLTIILMLSALSVVFTIVVLDIYFNHEDDEEIPHWVQKVTRTFLIKMAMWKGDSCCKRKKVTPAGNSSETVLTDIEYTPNGRSDTVMNEKFAGVDKEDAKSISGETGEKLYSWKEIALILDKCFMFIFIFLVVATTIICLSILGFNY